MAFIKIDGIKGLVYKPDNISTIKKNQCKDCFSCQFCSDSRCDKCLNKDKEKIINKINIY